MEGKPGEIPVGHLLHDQLPATDVQIGRIPVSSDSPQIALPTGTNRRQPGISGRPLA